MARVFYRTLENLSVSKIVGKDGTMRAVKLSTLFVLFACVLVMSGCAEDLRVQNDTQRRRIAELESEVQATKLRLDQLRRELDTAEGRCDVKLESLQQRIAALEEDLGKKKALIASMQQQLLFGGAQLPVELSTMLEDFADKEEMVTYDPSRGVVRFKSDLLFKSGSDVVQPAAQNAIKSLCGILNSSEAKQFDIIIAGHTDDQPIRHSRAKHATNWHLSAHRAISVLNMMEKNNMAPGRLSVRGFGEYRPAMPNQPDKKGEPQNRRVEIFIVAKGV
jgi:chemotaxis protein MotB